MGIDLSKFYQDYNFKNDGKLFYGIYKNRVLSIVEKGNYLKATISFNQQLSREIGQAISNKISLIKQENKALQKGLTSNVNLELYFYQSADLQFEFFGIIDKIYNVLEENGLATCEICPLCGQNMPSDAPFLKIRECVIQGHEHCVSQLLSTTSQLEKGMFKDDKKTMWKALLCNVITMLAILAVITGLSIVGAYGFVSIISGWLFLFVVKIVMIKSKIPVNTKYLTISVLFSILTCLLSVYFGTIFDLYVNNEVTLASLFVDYFKLLALEDYSLGKYVLTDLGLSLAFVVINVFFDYKRLKTNKNSIKKL